MVTLVSLSFYRIQQMRCSFDKYSVGADITGIISITEGNEYHLQSALATAGPISVAVDATTNSFRVSTYKHSIGHMTVT